LDLQTPLNLIEWRKLIKNMFAYKDGYAQLDHDTRLQLEVEHLNSRFIHIMLGLLEISQKRNWVIEPVLMKEFKKLILKEYPLYYLSKLGQIEHDRDTKLILVNFLRNLIAEEGELVGRRAWRSLDSLLPGKLDIADITIDATKPMRPPMPKELAEILNGPDTLDQPEYFFLEA
jgi:hypothetical protein